MKLYTEEQVKNMLSNVLMKGSWVDEFLLNYSSIELPSNEEIEKYIKSFPYTKHLDDGQYNDGVLVGAELGIEWVIDKIKNQQ